MSRAEEVPAKRPRIVRAGLVAEQVTKGMALHQANPAVALCQLQVPTALLAAVVSNA